MSAVRLLLLLLLLVAGCAHERVMSVTGPYPESPSVKRCLEYWTSNFSTNATNHFYVGAVRGGAIDAMVYWKEERTIISYIELAPDAFAVDEPRGAEIFAWYRALKLDRDTVDIDLGGSSYLVTHRTWINWMEPLLLHGREYVIRLDEAKRLHPPRENPDDI